MIITAGFIDSLLEKPLKERSRFPSHWLSGRQVAKKLGLNYKTTVFVWITEMGLEADRIGQGWLVDPKKLEEFLAEHPEFGSPKPEQAPKPGIKPETKEMGLKEPASSDETSLIVPPVNPDPIPKPPSTPAISKSASTPPSTPPSTGRDADRSVSIRLRQHGFRTDEVANALGIEKPTVEKWIEAEAVKAKKISGARGKETYTYIDKESLTRFLLEQRGTRINVLMQTGAIRWPT